VSDKFSVDCFVLNAYASTKQSTPNLPLIAALCIIAMKLSEKIKLEFNKENLLILLSHGQKPDQSPYTHKQIAEWCELFWNKYSDIDAPAQVEKIMPILADIETQWDLYLANTYSSSELKQLDFDSVNLPVEWFKNWSATTNA
jgi:hypothetical protein